MCSSDLNALVAPSPPNIPRGRSSHLTLRYFLVPPPHTSSPRPGPGSKKPTAERSGLDGGLRVDTILEISDEIGHTPRLPTTDQAALQAWFTAGAEARDLLKYLATFEHTIACMQTEAHIERVAYEAVSDLADDGVVYAEIRYAPELHNLPFAASAEAIAAGFKRAESDAQSRGKFISAHIIVCAMRTEKRSLEVAQFVDAHRLREPKIVSFDLAGAETGWPPSLHAEALAFARSRHLNITIHASEPPDLELISDEIGRAHV